MNVKKISLILAMGLLFACSGGNGGSFSSNPLDDLKKEEGAIKGFSKEDKDLLADYFNYLQKNSKGATLDSVKNKSYGEVLDKAREWKTISSSNAIFDQADKEATKQKNQATNEERQILKQKIEGMVKVSFLKKTVLAQAPEINVSGPAIQLEYDIENKSGKPIMALKGQGVFKDASEKVIFTYPFESQKTVAPGSHIQIKEIYELQPGKADLINLAKSQDGQFIFDFDPEIVLLEGGETLKMN